MGYSYDMRGRLACDVCGKCGGARKIKCPAGYCQAIAQCPTCRKDTAVQARIAKSHEHCGANHARFMAEQAERDRKLSAGQYVLSSALRHGDDHVHVLFRNKAGAHIGFYMEAEVYANRDKLSAYPTPESFRALGTIMPAPDDFQHARQA